MRAIASVFLAAALGLPTLAAQTNADNIQILHSFTGTSTDGSYPVTTLTQGTDGFLYGTTGGTAFKLLPDGTGFKLLHAFSEEGSGPLIQGGGGNFYGSTNTGGSTNAGTVFRLTATNQPTSFGVLGLPPGLRVDGKTGLISGTPTRAGTPKLTLKAANGAGTGQQALTLTVQPN